MYDEKGHKGTIRNVGSAPYLDLGGGYMGLHICSNSPSTIKVYDSLYENSTLIFKNKDEKAGGHWSQVALAFG